MLNFWFMFLMIFGTLIVLFYYLRIIYFIIMINSFQLKNYLNFNYFSKNDYLMSNFSNLMLVIFMLNLSN